MEAEHAGAASGVAADKQARDDGFIALARLLLRALGASRRRAALLSLATGLFAVVGATVGMQVSLNIWTKAFYDSLAQKDVAGFGRQLLIYVFIAGALIVLNVAQKWLSLTMKLKLREGLTRDLIAQWLAPRRAFLIAGAGAIGVNPDQRIHEDANHLSELSTDLGVGLLQSALLLICFIGVLWNLSQGVVLSFRGVQFSIHGYMVWAALAYVGAPHGRSFPSTPSATRANPICVSPSSTPTSTAKASPFIAARTRNRSGSTVISTG